MSRGLVIVAIAAAAVGAAGCRYAPTFSCDDSTQCGTGGRCEPDGLCSVPDGTCASGYRYEDYSGELSGECVGDSPAVIHAGFQFASSLTDESIGSHAISVALDAAATATVTLDVEVTGGSATRDVDYVLVTTQVTFLAGETRADVELSIAADGIEESDETIELTLVRPVGAELQADTHVATISANILPRVQFAAAASNALESATALALEVDLDVVATVDVVVGYSIGGSATTADHDLVTGMITIPAGQLTAQLTGTVVDDALDEDDETIVLTLNAISGAVTGAVATHTHTIANDDPPPQISFQMASSGAPESSGVVAVTVVLSAPSGKVVSFMIATSGTATIGSDYMVTVPPTIAPGDTSTSLQVSLVNDTLDEDDEDAIFTLTGATNASIAGPNATTLTILDEDPAVSVSWDPTEADQSIAEGDGSGTQTYLYDVVLGAASGKTVTVNLTLGGTANGQDGSVVGGPTLTFPPGVTSRMVTLNVNRDNNNENNDTFVMTLSTPTNATLTAPTTRVHTIIDDD